MKTFPIAALATLVLLATCQDAANITTGVPSSDVSADAPPAPTSLSASLLPDSFAIQVSFNHDGTGSPTHWQLLRHELDGSDTVVVEDVAGAGVRAIATTNFDVRGVAYEWLVAACNGAGCSAPSAPVVFSDTLEPPTNLRVTSTASGQVTLEWDDNSALEHKFELHRRGPPGGNANFVLAANRTSFTDRTAQTGVQYYYSVRARIDQADDRCSTWSDEVGVVPGSPAVSAPAVDSAHVVSVLRPDPETGRIELRGDINPENLRTVYWVEWSHQSSMLDPESTTPDTIEASPYFNDAPATIEFPYEAGPVYYRYVAQSSGGTTHGPIQSYDYGVPAAPYNLSGSLLADSFAIQISYQQDGLHLPNEWMLIRHVDNNSLTVDTAYGPDVRHLSTTNFNARGGTYTWTVMVCSDVGCSESGELLYSDTLAAPTNLHATSTEPLAVALAWQDNTAYEKNYELRRQDTDGNSKTWVLAANRTTFTDQTAVAGITYTYTVRARVENESSRSSLWSNTLAVVPGSSPTTAPPSVTTLDADSAWLAGDGYIRVNGIVNPNGLATTQWVQWSRNADMSAATSEVARAAGSGRTDRAVRDTFNFTFAEGLYYYRIVASNSDGTTYGGIRSYDYGFPAAPTNLTAQLDSATFFAVIHYQHDDARNPFTFRLYRRDTSTNRYPLVDTTADPAVRELSSEFDVRGVSYDWYVTACNTIGCSGYSTPVLFSDTLKAPANVHATSTAANNVTIVWQDNSTLEHGFEIRRRSSSGNRSWYVGPNVTSFNDPLAQAGVSYTYDVRAYLDQGDNTRSSNWSNTTIVTPN